MTDEYSHRSALPIQLMWHDLLRNMLTQALVRDDQIVEERVTKVTWNLYQWKAFSFQGAHRVACISVHRIIGLTAETFVIDAQDLPTFFSPYFTHQRLYPAPQFS